MTAEHAGRSGPVGPAGRPTAGGQGGYILGTVLAAMVIGMLLITALLSLSFTTHSAAITQQQLARERRAADGALETAVAGIRSGYSPAGTPCDSVSSPVAMDVEGDGTESPVAVVCSPILDPNPNVQGGVTVLGDTPYGGQSANGTEWAGWFGSPAPSVGLVHKGAQSLQMVGNVSVKTGGAVLGPSGSPGGPGLRVSGRYVQGEMGDGGSAATDCGAMVTPGPRQVVTAVDAPECGNDDARTITVAASTIPTPPATTSTVPATCPVGRLDLAPGRYGPSATAALNTLLAQPCNATYWFAAGTYWFDGDATSHSLTVNDHTSNIVFGDLDATGTACDPDGATATQVVLSGVTSLRHLAGNLSICAGAGASQPALVQAAESGSEPTLTVVSTIDKPFSPLANVTQPASVSPRARASLCPSVPFDCPGRAGFRATVNASGNRTVDSLKFRWVSQEQPYQAPLADPGRRIQVRLYNGATPVCTTGAVWAGRTAWLGSEVDVLAACPSLSGQPESVLNGLRLEVIWQLDYPLNCIGCTLEVSDARLLVNDRSFTPTAVSSSGGDWSPVDGLGAVDGNGATADGACTAYPNPLGGAPIAGLCKRPAPLANPQKQFTLTLPDAEHLPSGLQAADHLTSLVLALDVKAGDDWAGRSSGANPGVTQAVIEYAPGATCTAQATGYWRSKRTYYLDFGTCLQDAGQLAGATVTVSLQWELGNYAGGTFYPDASVKLPDLDQVRLVTSTDTIHQSQDSVIRVDETPGSASYSKFRVHGDTKLPRTNLDVLWNGGASTESLFNGSLVVNSLVSTDGAVSGRTVGVVCCGSADPTVRLRAYTDGNPSGVVRGAATVRLEPVPSGASEAVITDWQLCNLSGCNITDTLIGP